MGIKTVVLSGNGVCVWFSTTFFIAHWFAQSVVGGNIKSSHQNLQNLSKVFSKNLFKIFYFYTKLGGSVFQMKLRKSFKLDVTPHFSFLPEGNSTNSLNIILRTLVKVMFMCELRTTPLLLSPIAEWVSQVQRSMMHQMPSGKKMRQCGDTFES